MKEFVCSEKPIHQKNKVPLKDYEKQFKDHWEEEKQQEMSKTQRIEVGVLICLLPF